MQLGDRLRSRLRPKARKILSDLYNLQRTTLGRAPAMSDFYPVKLQEIVESVLGWRIKEIDSLGITTYGRPIVGRCDFQQKVILLATTRTDPGERAFTLAHEIGHVVLHSKSPACLGRPLHRPKSRRHQVISNSDPDSNRIEREAQVFASELLMPEAAVRRIFRETLGFERLSFLSAFASSLPVQGEVTAEAVAKCLAVYKSAGQVLHLSQRFGVSDDAMGFRLEELSLVF